MGCSYQILTMDRETCVVFRPWYIVLTVVHRTRTWANCLLRGVALYGGARITSGKKCHIIFFLSSYNLLIDFKSFYKLSMVHSNVFIRYVNIVYIPHTLKSIHSYKNVTQYIGLKLYHPEIQYIHFRGTCGSSNWIYIDRFVLKDCWLNQKIMVMDHWHTYSWSEQCIRLCAYAYITHWYV